MVDETDGAEKDNGCKQQDNDSAKRSLLAEADANKDENDEELERAKQELAELERKWRAFLGRYPLLKSPNFWTGLTTIVIAIATVVYTHYAAKQWEEMHSGGTDTHELAIQAKNQADSTRDLANQMKEQSDRTKELAGQTKSLADSAKTQETQATIQAQEARVSADAAKSASDAAVSGLRPWVKITDVKSRGEGPGIPALSGWSCGRKRQSSSSI